MVKRTKTILWPLPKNGFVVFDHFMGADLLGLIELNILLYIGD